MREHVSVLSSHSVCCNLLQQALENEYTPFTAKFLQKVIYVTSPPFLIYIYFFSLVFFVLFCFVCMCWVFAAACRLSLVAAGVATLAAVHRLLVAATSLVAERRLQLYTLSSCGAQA